MPSRLDVLPLKDTTQLCIDVFNETLATLQYNRQLLDIFNKLVATKISILQKNSDGFSTRCIIDVAATANYRNADDVLSAIVRVLNDIYEIGSPHKNELPILQISATPSYPDEARYTMQLTLLLPQTDPQKAAKFATDIMVQFIHGMHPYNSFSVSDLRYIYMLKSPMKKELLFKQTKRVTVVYGLWIKTIQEASP